MVQKSNRRKPKTGMNPPVRFKEKIGFYMYCAGLGITYMEGFGKEIMFILAAQKVV